MDERRHNNGRREMDAQQHDDVCDRRLSWIKYLLVAILGSVAIGGGFGYSQNEDMKQVNATQTADIEHNERTLDKMERKFDEHINTQNIVNKEILDSLHSLKIDITTIKREVQ